MFQYCQNSCALCCLHFQMLYKADMCNNITNTTFMPATLASVVKWYIYNLGKTRDKNTLLMRSKFEYFYFDLMEQ